MIWIKSVSCAVQKISGAACKQSALDMNTKIASQLIIGRLAGYISNERKVFHPYFLSIVYSIGPSGRKLSQLDETLLFHSVLPHIKGSSSASAGTSSNHFCTGKLTSFPGHPGFYHIIDRTTITVGHTDKNNWAITFVQG